jgi:hypothetical protein
MRKGKFILRFPGKMIQNRVRSVGYERMGGTLFHLKIRRVMSCFSGNPWPIENVTNGELKTTKGCVPYILSGITAS